MKKSKYAAKNKTSYITKLFFRIFLSSLILLVLVTFAPKKIKNKMQEDISFLKFIKTFNTMFGNIIVLDDNEYVDSTLFYDQIDYKDNINYVKDFNFDGVYNLNNGIITKIIKNDNQTYTIYIKTEDDFLYVYYDLISVDYRLYEYIKKGEIIGKISKTNNEYNLKIEIKKDGKNYDYYEIS